MAILWEQSFAPFLVLTLVLGGGAAWMTGQALARGWRPASRVALYMLLLGLAVRFFHWSLGGGTLIAPWYYLVDTAILVAISLLSWRFKRTQQMVHQYPWLYRRTGPLTWTTKEAGPAHDLPGNRDARKPAST